MNTLKNTYGILFLGILLSCSSNEPATEELPETLTVSSIATFFCQSRNAFNEHHL